LKIRVLPTPAGFGDSGAGTCAVVIDVFRASTTITTAIANGARSILPVTEVEQAVKLAEPYAKNEVVLAGERDCRPIDGFDLGNSPREFTREAVGGKVVIFTSTNGTRALAAARGAGTVLVGCFLNFGEIVRVASGYEDVVILCAGNEDRLSLEDFVCAGGLVTRLARRGTVLDDPAVAARAAFRSIGASLSRTLFATEHARRLTGLGFRPDLDLALRIDSVPLVPRFADGRIEPAPA
jgi:2-phosphosulfolactate phosphatase